MSRIDWYARRLRSMAPAEIALHSQRAIRYRYDDLTWRAARPVWRRAWEPSSQRIIARGAAPESALLLRSARVEDVRSALAAAERQIMVEAEQRLEGRVRVFGHPVLALGRERAFDRDPITGRPWPDRHGRLIDYRLARPGDPKLVWELERCQELPLLVIASLLTGDPRFADAAARRLCDWLASHPPGRGVAWANAFEPAIRALSLAVAFDSLRGHPLLAGGVADDVVRGLWQHGRWILRDRSRYSSANNHLVGELAGLLAVAILVPELRDSCRWRELATEGLIHEARMQVLPDGSGAEQSFAYWLFIVDLLLTCASLLDAGGLARPGAIVDALRRAADVLALLVDVEEPEPAFGDDDGGRALMFDGEQHRGARGVAASLAALLGHPGARRLAGAVDPTAALLFGAEGLARFESAGPASPPRDGLLRDAGLVVLRRAGTRALFDVGALGYLSIAAHGHADALQLVISHTDDELVSDPGTGSYLGNPGLRHRLRGTAAHSTVCVDSQDQSRQDGPFLWRQHAHARLLMCDLELGVAVGEHDGYMALPDPVLHRRAIVALSDGGVLVLDRLSGASEHTYVQTWPLHPALEPHVHEHVHGRVIASGHGRPGIVLALTASVPSEIVLDSEGRWSRRLDESEPAWVIRHRLTAKAPVEIGAFLLPVAQDAQAPVASLELTRDGDVSRARITLGEHERCLDLDLTKEAPVVRADG
jgi:hypothetical protein